MKECTLLVGHGSRDEDGNREFLDFVSELQIQVPNQHFEACFLELTTPTIPEGIENCVRQGVDKIVVVPIILLAASHVKLEIPAFLDQAREKFPNVDIVYGRNIGLHEQMIDLLTERFSETLLQEGDVVKDRTAIVLMGRGSSDPDANGDLYKIARQVWERTGVLTVEVCFTGVTFPRVPDGIHRAVALGADRVVVVPYFLFTGVLMKRMQHVLRELQAEYVDVPMSMAPYFGSHQRLKNVALDRRVEAIEGRAFMNCDLCKYRKQATHDHDHDHDHHHANHHAHHSDHDVTTHVHG